MKFTIVFSLLAITFAAASYCNCQQDLLGNGYCNDECNNVYCNWDGLDCAIESNRGCQFVALQEVGKVYRKSNSFDDILDLNVSCDWKISQLEIFWSGNFLQALRTQYIHDGRITESEWTTRNNRAPNQNRVDTYRFASNEFITQISGSYLNGFRSLEINTNLGQKISYGRQAGQQFTVNFPKGYYLAALSGKLRGRVEYLTFYAFADPGAECSCAQSDLGNGVCTSFCDIPACDNDGGDCSQDRPYAERVKYCSCYDTLYNGYCNEECNNFECLWDTLDCAIESNNNCYFGKLGSFGSGGRNDFNDINELNLDCETKIKSLSFNMARNGRLQSLETTYDMHGTTVHSGWRQRAKGNPRNFEQFELAANEFITYFAIWQQNNITYGVEFSSNLGRKVKLGRETGTKYEVHVPAGYVLAAISGNYDNQIKNLTFYTTAFPKDHCPCGAHALGDGTCTTFCNTKACGYDGKDCSRDDCACEQSQLGNGTCERECFNEACYYDKGDCGEPIKGCDCPPVILGDGNCDNGCDTKECFKDGGDCSKYPNCSCDIDTIGNGKCNVECFNSSCGFDEGDCGERIPGCNCPPIWIGNGTCESSCKTDACKNDGGDCSKFPNCKCDTSKIRNGECDFDCFNVGCIYDGGDCGQVIKDCPCPKIMLENDECNPECNVAGCRYDGGECQLIQSF